MINGPAGIVLDLDNPVQCIVYNVHCTLYSVQGLACTLVVEASGTLNYVIGL